LFTSISFLDFSLFKIVVEVACGEQHSLAVDDLGSVYAWGRNREGQCGQGSSTNYINSPVRVDALLHERIVKVVAGSHQSFAITDEGRLYRWGLFHERALNSTPQYFGLTGMKNISQETRYMIDRSHYLYFSNKSEDEITHDEDVETVAAFRRRSFLLPEVLEVEEGKRVVDVAAGYCFYLVITEDGSVYSFGFNDKGQLGLGNRFSQESPTLISGLKGYKIVKAIAGQQHTVVLTDDGKVASWGGGVFGLGHGDGEDLLLPRFIEALLTKRVVQLSCGTYHTFCITDEGDIYSFGHGEYGQQGTGDIGEKGEQSRNALFPRKMQVSWNSKIKGVYCGHLHTIFVLEDGSVWTCGWGSCGVLGHGDQKYRVLPTQIKALEGDNIRVASGGWKHNLAIKDGSTTFAFDFEKLLVTPKNTDITFIVDKKPIHAHKMILCHRCPKIRAMVAFCERLGQTTATEVQIKGTRFVVFKAMVSYLYTDHLNIPPFFAPEVATLAKNFGLPRLVGLCQQLFFKSKEAVMLPQSSFSFDLMDLIDNPKYSDLIFRFPQNGHEFYGHKMILTARCPYFHALFEGGGHFKDSDSSVMNLDRCPIQPETFLLTLQYIYTGDRSIITPEVALEMLAAADYFLLDDLKRICEDVVEKNLEIEQETLEVVADSAEMYGAKRLAHFCRIRLTTLPQN